MAEDGNVSGRGKTDRGFPGGKQPKGLTTVSLEKRTARAMITPMELGLGLPTSIMERSRCQTNKTSYTLGVTMDWKTKQAYRIGRTGGRHLREGLLPKDGHALGN